MNDPVRTPRRALATVLLLFFTGIVLLVLVDRMLGLGPVGGVIAFSLLPLFAAVASQQ